MLWAGDHSRSPKGRPQRNCSRGYTNTEVGCPLISDLIGWKHIGVADVFLDTNILLYLLSADTRKVARAEELLASGGVISVQVLNEFVAAAGRKAAMEFREIREIFSTIRGLCAVRPVDIRTHELAVDLAEQRRFSIYDALIVAAAVQAECAVLYTEDLQHNQRIERLTIKNPFLAD
jgi:predicted nucleic acid-binding protein